jgi:hypothetical protein
MDRGTIRPPFPRKANGPDRHPDPPDPLAVGTTFTLPNPATHEVFREPKGFFESKSWPKAVWAQIRKSPGPTNGPRLFVRKPEWYRGRRLRQYGCRGIKRALCRSSSSSSRTEASDALIRRKRRSGRAKRSCQQATRALLPAGRLSQTSDKLLVADPRLTGERSD